MKLRVLTISFLLALIYTSCKKEDNQNNIPPNSKGSSNHLNVILTDGISGKYKEVNTGEIMTVHLKNNQVYCKNIDDAKFPLGQILDAGSASNIFESSCKHSANQYQTNHSIEINGDTLLYRRNDYDLFTGPINPKTYVYIKTTNIKDRDYEVCLCSGTQIFNDYDSNGILIGIVTVNLSDLSVHWQFQQDTMRQAPNHCINIDGQYNYLFRGLYASYPYDLAFNKVTNSLYQNNKVVIENLSSATIERHNNYVLTLTNNQFSIIGKDSAIYNSTKKIRSSRYNFNCVY